MMLSSTLGAQYDPHSAARPDEAVIRHMNLELDVDFEHQILKGQVRFRVEQKGTHHLLHLDTRNLNIDRITLDSGKKASWSYGEEQPFLGKALRIELENDTKEVLIEYQTTAGSDAIQWLKPDQTAGKKAPFLFTQGQAILSRTWIPVQDSPGIRFTWEAKVHVPDGYMAVMSGTNSRELRDDATYSCSMELPVPAYLIALSVGQLEFRAIGDRCGVYAEPVSLDAAAREFSDMEAMLKAAETLYGPYMWGRYDVLLLPPSFPFGGMENPRLTFATPTIIAGDKSLTSLIAHELAHSWSGNLVTNSTWNDFWLNEGFTVYFERRIMEALYGADYAAMLEVLGYEDLSETLEDLGKDSPDTRLMLSLEGRDPDEGMSDIAYEKGCFLLRYIEKQVGRPAFDAFLKGYFKEFGFKGITTERFVKYLQKQLKLNEGQMQVVQDWIYKPGLPAAFVPPTSTLFDRVAQTVEQFTGGKIEATALPTQTWSTHEYLYFIRNLPQSLDSNAVQQLETQFHWNESGNSEIRFAWLMFQIRRGDTTIRMHCNHFLATIGRRKFVLPMYRALLAQHAMEANARKWFELYRNRYHAVTRQSVEEILKPSK